MERNASSGAKLGRDGRPDATGHHQSRQHRCQFAQHRDGDHRPHGRVHLHLVKLQSHLHGKHHAGKGTRNHNHRLRLPADLVGLLDGLPPSWPARECRAHNVAEQDYNAAKLGDDAPSHFTQTCNHFPHGSRE
jgi:hypothetical protein